VLVEVRWPEGQTVPATDSLPRQIVLGSVNGETRIQRASTSGPLWLEDARLENGRWIVPGAVELFTERGKRSIEVRIGDSTVAGFILPIPRRPGREDLEWTPWYPNPPAGSPPWPADKFSIRYKLQARDQPIRIQSVGPFEIATTAFGFTPGERGPSASGAEFSIRYRGRPVELSAPESSPTEPMHIDAAGVVVGSTPALMLRATDEQQIGYCYLVTAPDDSVRTALVGPCPSGVDADVLTSDPLRFHRHRDHQTTRGEIDRVTYREPGLFLVGNAVVDTRQFTIRRLPDHQLEISEVPDVPPIAVSPDERSMVRFVYDQHSSESPALLVVDIIGDTATLVPVNRDRMRYGDFADLDPAWVDHHFRWSRGSDGIDRLTERPNFKPLPYRGRLTTTSDGSHYYALTPGGQPLADAIVAFLVSELGGTRLPRGEYETSDKVRVGQNTVSVSPTSGATDPQVSVSLAVGEQNATLIPEIAHRFDQALASGKYDQLFRKP
jgi:hypothetical protein